ncbi:MAG: hypothetical protein JJU45_13085 [Acidimicrobiia bacterium]|nr:hypothetical protein [Acidimicrobiia bacterium]
MSSRRRRPASNGSPPSEALAARSGGPPFSDHWPTQPPQGPPAAGASHPSTSLEQQPPPASGIGTTPTVPPTGAPTRAAFAPPDVPVVEPAPSRARRRGWGLLRAAAVIVVMALAGGAAGLAVDHREQREATTAAAIAERPSFRSLPRGDWEVLLLGCDAVGSSSVLINGRVRNLGSDARTMMVELMVFDSAGRAVGAVEAHAGTVFPERVGLFRELAEVGELGGGTTITCRLSRVLAVD